MGSLSNKNFEDSKNRETTRRGKFSTNVQPGGTGVSKNTRKKAKTFKAGNVDKEGVEAGSECLKREEKKTKKKDDRRGN